ncbi:hypothetical protein ES332_D05G293300v1 [Gossypium tomentosum]|uniref:Uncharacterized protein n=1 Tax=Gossypium tomentosum TaxID=34277 RepID=A0A5D2L1G7_GOSTO|nr:hypothetical protein ES332_D05G293300v1 [Gossypium tomentosum]
MLRRSCAFNLCQDSDCNEDGQRSGGQVRPYGGTVTCRLAWGRSDVLEATVMALGAGCCLGFLLVFGPHSNWATVLGI